jgi:hypothetical protein
MVKFHSIYSQTVVLLFFFKYLRIVPTVFKIGNYSHK